MKDRVPVNPGRVLITPENGAAPYYATMTRADNPTQEGTALNKANLLKDATAAKLGLGADAVPDDAFNVLSRFQNGLGNEYVWTKYAVETVKTYDIETTGVRQVNTDAEDFYYSASFHIADDLFVLDNPSKISWVYPDDLSDLVGKYCISGGTNTSGGTMYLIDSRVHVSGTSIYCNAPTMYSNIHDEEVYELVGYVNSPDPNAYPINDGYTYTALGQLGNKAQIATGSYTGTGTFGRSNPNSLTFDFVPLFVVVTQQSTYGPNTILLVNGQTRTSHLTASSSSYGLTVSWNDNVVNWYANSSDGAESSQLNMNGNTYYYAAIG